MSGQLTNRALRHLIDERLASTLRRHGLMWARDLIGASELDLVEQLDLSLDEVRALRASVAKAVSPKPTTALEALDAGVDCARLGVAPVRHLRTGFAPLDQHLGGGLPLGTISELVGPAGAGKTQLCLSLVAHTLLCGDAASRVVYVDTEGSFSSERLFRILQELLSRGVGCERRSGGALHALTSLADTEHHAESLLERVQVMSPNTWSEYVGGVEAEIQRPDGATLIVLDSVAAAVRWEFADSDIVRRQEFLASHAAKLKQFAAARRAGVLCVNQIGGAVGTIGYGEHASHTISALLKLRRLSVPTPRLHPGVAEGDVSSVHGLEDAQLTAFLGTMWAHCVNARLVLQHAAVGETYARTPPPPPPPDACISHPQVHASRRYARPPPPPPPPGVHAGVEPTPMRLRVAKAAICADATFEYIVGAAGLTPPGEMYAHARHGHGQTYMRAGVEIDAPWG